MKERANSGTDRSSTKPTCNQHQKASSSEPSQALFIVMSYICIHFWTCAKFGTHHELTFQQSSQVHTHSFMASTVEMQPSYSSKKQDDSDFNFTEWGAKGRISRENSKSRRYSASYIRSFREDTRSFRSNITISSTASSPGYPLKGTFLVHSLQFNQFMKWTTFFISLRFFQFLSQMK